jgi:hypothetical protein
MIIGIDNGLDGGIVALSPLAGLAPIAKYPMPTRSVTYPARKTTKARTTREIDTPGVVAILDAIGGNRSEITVYFEHCPFHASDATAMRSMALSAGKILAVLEAKRFKTVRILSFDWHPIILGKIPQGQTKSVAIAKARELWPDEDWAKSEKAKTFHDGMIDAALIAEYGRRIQFPTMVPDSREDGVLPWA